MANFKVPRRFEILEAMPTNATGKILKSKLIDAFADALATPPEASQ